jgi:hypothetical protein
MESYVKVFIFMILLYAVIVGLAASLMRARLTHRILRLPRLNWEWLVFISVIPQVFAFYISFSAQFIPDSILPGIQILSMAGLVLFALKNVLAPGFWALGLGLLCNFLVITSNGGWMPISVDTLQRMVPARSQDYWTVGSRLGFSKDRIMDTGGTHLVWLSDKFTLPPGLPQNVVFSLGDVFISIGAFLLLWSLSRNEEKENT